MLYLLSFICYALSAMLYLLSFICFALSTLSAMLYKPSYAEQVIAGHALAVKAKLFNSAFKVTEQPIASV